MDCFVASAPLRKRFAFGAGNDGRYRRQIHVRILAARRARGLLETSRPLKQRAQGMPDARCTRGLACELCKQSCTRAYRAAENIRHSLRNGFTAYIELSPANGLIATFAPEKR